MKKTTKLLLSFLLVFVILVVSVTQFYAETVIVSNGFSYTILNDNYISICDWEGGSDTLTIPDKLDDSVVKEISGWAFNEREDFSGLVLSSADHLDTIGTMAFKNCINLTDSLTIPAHIKTIKSGAFQGCSSLKTLYYNTNASVSEQCFYSCTGLETVSLADGVTSIGRLAFANCTSLELIRIPDTVTSINEYAFNNCPKLKIYCYRDSYAQKFAEDNGYDFYILDPLLGDSNADGDVDIMDATYIQKYKIGAQGYDLTEYQRRCADVNRDGKVTVRDATLIQMKLAKYDVDF